MGPCNRDLSEERSDDRQGEDRRQVATVVVRSYRRPDALLDCLDGLFAGSRLPDQIVVVLRDSDEESHEALNDWLRENADRGTQMVETADVSQPGQIVAANAGLRLAACDVVCFTDDDCVVADDWLERLLSHYVDSPNVVGVGGRDVVHHGDRVEFDPKAQVGGLTRYGRMIGNHHQPGFDEPRVVKHLKGANMSYRRSSVSAFDERIKGAHFEDTDFSLVARASGGELIYDPKATVHHYPAPRMAGFNRNSERAEEVFADAHDWAYVMLKHLSAVDRVAFWLFALALGQDRRYGLLRMLAKLPREGRTAIMRWRATLRGLMEARKTIRHAATGESQ